MKTSQFCVPALLVTLGVTCAGVVSCSKSSNPPAEKGGGGLLLIGAGATFPYPIYSKWMNEYHKSHSDVAINYQSIGSGGGIRQVIAGTVDFGASDAPMTDEQIKQFQQQRGCDILHFPLFWEQTFHPITFPESKRNLTSRRKPWRGYSWARSINGTILFSRRPIRE